MRVFVAGATGVIGVQLLPALREAGHVPIAMTRSREKAAALDAAGVQTAVCDVYDTTSLKRAVAEADADALVHLLTDIPAELDVRHMERDLASTGRLRSEGTHNLLSAASAAGVQRILAQSIAFAYAPLGSRVKDEDAPLDTDGIPFVTKPLLDLESQVLAANGIVLRYGQLYGPSTSFARDGSWAENVRRRRLPIVGGGGGMFSFLHTKDAAAAAVASLGHDGPAVFNVVDDEPAAVREWLPHYARSLGAPAPRSVPAWMARPLAGRMAVGMMTELRGADNARAKRELGWQPQFPTWREGLPAELA
jgi:nucleoside-diphosphate-sugar epimerase